MNLLSSDYRLLIAHDFDRFSLIIKDLQVQYYFTANKDVIDHTNGLLHTAG